VLELLDAREPAIVCIEGYSSGVKGNAYLLYELGFQMRLQLVAKKYQVVEVPPSSLKKFITGSGVADKMLMALTIQKKYDVQFATSDEFDAFGLAQIASCLAGHTQPTNEKQRAELAKLRKQLE
jgi:Holliday junction resolvasome RuvABC endonuclease subunit